MSTRAPEASEPARATDPARPAAPPKVPENSANRFAHIDALRAFAVGLVLLQHAGLSQSPGDAGVTVFFSISGFIITFILLRERDKTGGFGLGRFYVRRLLKLGPPFLVAILIPTLVYAIFVPVNWGAVLSQVFFSYNWVQIFDNEASLAVLPGSNVVWSLGVEEQFYIVFALLWLVVVRFPWWRRALVATAIAAIVWANAVRVVALLQDDSVDRILRATDARMDAIAWGVLAAVLFHHGLKRDLRWQRILSRDAVLVVAVLVFVAVFAWQQDGAEQLLRQAVHPICAVAVILYGLLPSGSRLQNGFYAVSRWRPVALVGLASYSLYIVHYVVTEPLWEAWHETLPLPVIVPLLLAISLAAGLAVYFLIEKPVLAFRTRRGW